MTSENQTTPRDMPQTFTERVAYALAMHDILNGEGRMTDEELSELRWALGFIKQVVGPANYPTKCRNLRGFVRLEEALRDTSPSPFAKMKIAQADWRNYLRADGAAVAVLAERPEALAQMEAMSDG